LRRVPAWALKGGAICLTVLATVGAADYVGGHVKNQAAPLRPALQPVTGVQAPADRSVQTTQAQPVTETYVS
jgi:hypothetical protein